MGNYYSYESDYYDNNKYYKRCGNYLITFTNKKPQTVMYTGRVFLINNIREISTDTDVEMIHVFSAADITWYMKLFGLPNGIAIKIEVGKITDFGSHISYFATIDEAMNDPNKSGPNCELEVI